MTALRIVAMLTLGAVAVVGDALAVHALSLFSRML